MPTTSGSSMPASGAARVFGNSTDTPCWMIGAVTMKMTRSTSITSTSGVTLICAMLPLPPRLSKPAIVLHLISFQEVPLGDVEKLRREVVHLRREHAHLPRERVVGDD